MSEAVKCCAHTQVYGQQFKARSCEKANSQSFQKHYILNNNGSSWLLVISDPSFGSAKSSAEEPVSRKSVIPQPGLDWTVPQCQSLWIDLSAI